MDNFNFPVSKAPEYITKCAKRCLEKIRKYCTRMKENSFLSNFIQKFPGEWRGMPPDPPKGLGPYMAYMYMAKCTSMLWLKIAQQWLLQILLRTL
jgi:hypothetical protein